MDNRKIKNATKTTSLGIEFKSHLESMIYKTLIEYGITPLYECKTFEFVPRIRPTVPFYNRVNKVFGLEAKPLQPITYTPDFTFEYNGILIIIEAKGFENDVYPVKKNLFRRHLEVLKQPAIFFEIRTKKELLMALKIIKMESVNIQRIRKLIISLPEKDIPIGNKLLEKRDWKELLNLVSSAIIKIEKALSKDESKYADIDLDSLYILQSEIPEFLDDNDNYDEDSL
jgi:hypothetical protein